MSAGNSRIQLFCRRSLGPKFQDSRKCDLSVANSFRSEAALYGNRRKPERNQDGFYYRADGSHVQALLHGSRNKDRSRLAIRALWKWKTRKEHRCAKDAGEGHA